MGACAEQKAAGQTLRVEIGNEIGLIVARSAQGVHVGVVAQFAVQAGHFTPRRLTGQIPLRFIQQAVAVQIKAFEQAGLILFPFGQQIATSSRASSSTVPPPRV